MTEAQKIRVAVNGYGVIGKRVAAAVAQRPDMSLAGVSDGKELMFAGDVVVHLDGVSPRIASVCGTDYEDIGVARVRVPVLLRLETSFIHRGCEPARMVRMRCRTRERR